MLGTVDRTHRGKKRTKIILFSGQQRRPCHACGTPGGGLRRGGSERVQMSLEQTIPITWQNDAYFTVQIGSAARVQPLKVICGKLRALKQLDYHEANSSKRNSIAPRITEEKEEGLDADALAQLAQWDMSHAALAALLQPSVEGPTSCACISTTSVEDINRMFNMFRGRAYVRHAIAGNQMIIWLDIISTFMTFLVLRMTGNS
ncbi:hypothetical protein FGB62_232g02 [Gracilaria domingensis]|nr:hypothetical protein FGB62_232g02 [Gracilaria domingensis]